MTEQREVLARLVAWGEAEPNVRALVLTSSRARDDGSADELSDYDVIVALRDVEAFADSYGPRLVGWGDEHETLGMRTYFRGVVYEDGVRIDYTLWPEELLDRVGEPLPEDLDVGYRVLLDKDGRTREWPPPTFRAHVPSPPTAVEYRALVEEFWWDTLHFAKALRRGELVFAKFLLDYDAKFVALRRMLEWRAELDHDWSLRPGGHGRGLERLVSPDVWSELAATYVGVAVEENWEALFRTCALFRRVATEVADELGYEYPQEVDHGVTRLLEAARKRSVDSPRDGA